VKTKKLTLVVISSLIALNLNYIGAGQAQAAKCSAYDVKLRKAVGQALLEDVNLLNPLVIYPGNMLEAVKTASKKSKSKKLRSAWEEQLLAMMEAVAYYPEDWLDDSAYVEAQKKVINIFKKNLC
jgi:hypothetical protein